MNLTYNNIQGASGLVTFTGIPNILKVEDTAGGTYATFSLMFRGDMSTVATSDGALYISLFGETISNVIDYSNAVNKNFWVSSSYISTASSVAKALRNCPNIAANFTIEHNDDEVELKGRAPGKMFTGSGWFSTNIPSTYMTYTAYDGSTNGMVGSIVSVNVIANGNYITNLEKNFYGSECAFDMSPVLTTVSQMGRSVPYRFDVSYTQNGEYNFAGSVGTNYIVNGYMCNQGARFIDSSTFTIAQNYSRGSAKGVDNNTILYIYEPFLKFSFYNGNRSSIPITVKYLNSAYEQVSSATTSWTRTDSNNKLWDIDIMLSQQDLLNAFYVDVEIGDKTIRYNVIKPVKATEYNQRIYWRNSYGGISFFDFTGQKTESRNINVDTYQKNIFGYYSDSVNELEMVYNNDISYDVSLKSHIIDNDGKYIFNDMIQTSYAWTEINGENYAIIIDSVSVDELDRNNTYEATVKYRYSQKPSLI